MYLSVHVSDVVGTESEIETTRPAETLGCINQVAVVSILTYSNTYGFPLFLFFFFGAIAPFRANVEWQRTVEGPFLGGGLLSERERDYLSLLQLLLLLRLYPRHRTPPAGPPPYLSLPFFLELALAFKKVSPPVYPCHSRLSIRPSVTQVWLGSTAAPVVCVSCLFSSSASVSAGETSAGTSSLLSLFFSLVFESFLFRFGMYLVQVVYHIHCHLFSFGYLETKLMLFNGKIIEQERERLGCVCVSIRLSHSVSPDRRER